MQTWSSSNAVGCTGFVCTFCWVFHVLQLQTRGLFHPPTVPVPPFFFQLQRCCITVFDELRFSHFWVKQEEKTDKWAASARRVPGVSDFSFCLDKANCKLPWNVLKQPWNSAFPSLISLRETRQPEPKARLILCRGKGYFLFLCCVCQGLPAWQNEKRQRRRPDFRTALARQPRCC